MFNKLPALYSPSRIYYIFAFILALAALSSCVSKFDKDKKQVSFKQVTGINFTEVHRYFDTGLSFNKDGYQLYPEWKLSFLPNNKASIYDPFEKRFLTFTVTLDHDSIFSVANTWLKALKVTKDSLMFRVLNVVTDTIYYDSSRNYMLFYSADYMNNVLHKTPDELQQPRRIDSLYIIKRVKEVNAHADSFFAAREPVILKSKSPLVTVVKKKVEMNVMNRYDNSDEYMSPEYDITIHKAYQDFYYSFYVTVDTQGQLHFQKSLITVFDEFKESTNRIIKGIVDGYLKAYVQVIPGKTLGFAHNSAVILNVTGKKINLNLTGK
jgi:hypothetical protein